MPDVCRLCLKELPAGINLFDSQAVLLLIKTIECLQLSINQGDGLPPRVCQSCAQNVSTFHSFWKLAHRCDQYLRKTLEKSESALYTSKTEKFYAKHDPHCDTDNFDVVGTFCAESKNSSHCEDHFVPVFIVSERPFENQVSVINECGTPRNNITRVIKSTTAVDHQDNYYYKLLEKKNSKEDSLECEKKTEKTKLIAKNKIGKGTFKCQECSAVFGTASLRNKHSKRVHDIFCFECKKHFKTIATLIAHNIKFHETPPFQCAICNEKFTYKASLYWHVKSHNTTSSRTCEICGHKFKKLHDFKRHLFKHNPNSRNVIRCTLCEQVCSSEVSFKKHMSLHKKKHNAEQKYKCSECKYSSDNKQYFNMHLKRHSKMPQPIKVFCEECKLGFSNNIQLTTHEIETHGRPPFECAICCEKFKSKIKIYSHILSHDSSSSYVCDVCGLTYTKKSSFLRHNSRRHSGVETKVQCSHCQKFLSTREHLRRHMLIHINQRNFMCSVCGKRFLSKTYLTEHSRTHSGVKPFNCHVCDKGFSQKGSLNIHVRTHTGERPFVCDFCGKGFIMSTLLKYHLRKCPQKAGESDSGNCVKKVDCSPSCAPIPVITQACSLKKESVITSVTSNTVSVVQLNSPSQNSCSVSNLPSIMPNSKSQPFSVIMSHDF